jgi:hypothetical protein
MVQVGSHHKWIPIHFIHAYYVCDPEHSNWVKKSQNMAGLAQENDFAHAHVYSLLRLVKECNKYDLTFTVCLANDMFLIGQSMVKVIC